MAHWQACDGTRMSVLAMAQLAHIVRHAVCEGHSLPPSIRQMDWDAAAALQGWYYATYRKRLPSRQSRNRLRIVFGFARQALIAACHDGPWWQLDDWHPSLRPADPADQPRAGGQLRLLTRADHPTLAAGSGEMAPGHDAGIRRVALDQRQPGTAAMPSALRQVAHLVFLRTPPRYLATPQRRSSRPPRSHAGPPTPVTAPPENPTPATSASSFLLDPSTMTYARSPACSSSWWPTPPEARPCSEPVHGSRSRPRTQTAGSVGSPAYRDQREFNDTNYIDEHALAQITAALPLIGIAPHPADDPYPRRRHHDHCRRAR